MERVVVVGTGTGVGKTHVGCALLAAARHAGIEAIGLKPVESGLASPADPASDAAALRARSARPTPAPLYALADPISPHLAAERAGLTLEVAPIVRYVEAHAARLLLVETAGGLLSPLSLRSTNLDLALALQPANVLLVSLDRLGVLHDVAASLLALRSRGLGARVVLNAPVELDASTGTNAAELERLHGVDVTLLPRDEPDAPASVRAARRLLAPPA